MERYAIQSWWVTDHGQIGLIISDAAGAAYLFWGGVLQLRWSGPAAADRLARAVARQATPLPALATGSHTLPELRRLIAGADGTVLN